MTVISNIGLILEPVCKLDGSRASLLLQSNMLRSSHETEIFRRRSLMKIKSVVKLPRIGKLNQHSIKCMYFTAS